MKKRNLEEWLSLCTGSLSNSVHMQDRYMNLRVADMVNCLEEPDREVITKLLNETAGVTAGSGIYDIVFRTEEKNFLPEEEADEEFPPELYALVIAPFAEWILRTEYKPDFEFPAKTETNLYFSEVNFYEDPEIN